MSGMRARSGPWLYASPHPLMPLSVSMRTNTRGRFPTRCMNVATAVMNTGSLVTVVRPGWLLVLCGFVYTLIRWSVRHSAPQMWRCGRELLLERAQFHQPRQPRVERCAHLIPCPSWPRSSTESRLLMRCVRANHRESPRAGDCRSLRKEHGETLGSNRCVHARYRRLEPDRVGLEQG